MSAKIFFLLGVCLASFAAEHERYGKLPLSFIPNLGQIAAPVAFIVKTDGLTADFEAGGVSLRLRGTNLAWHFLGANPRLRIEGLDPQEGRANFLLGDDPSQWLTGIPLYSRVAYRDVYTGIDVLYGGENNRLKADFVVAPDADPSLIRVRYTGVDSLSVAEDGSLTLKTKAGDLREAAPVIYQESGEDRVPIEGAFVLLGPDIVGFRVGDYDPTRPLVIDPVLSYSTYLGGGGTDRAQAIAVDGSGSAYVTGYTDSINFPTTAGVVRPASGGGVDVFVAKLNAAGSALVYATYLGGSSDDRGFSIAVDGSGNAYIAGWTSSSNFPTASPIQGTSAGGRDAFIAKLNAAGSALLYSTYLGGSGTDSANGIALDSGLNAYIAGSTTSTNFPLAGAYQTTNRGLTDAFAAKINTAGSATVYSTYIGGTADDRATSIAVDTSGSAYVTGTTASANFPLLTPAQATTGGGQDAFVTKFSSSGAALAYSTFAGGSGTETMETGRGIAVDSSNSAYITGTTTSSNLPVTSPMQASSGGGSSDAFVLKLSPAGSARVYSTYLGGASVDAGSSIAVDSGGSAYVAGYTGSANFPTVGSQQPSLAGLYDAFVVRLTAAGASQMEGAFLGGAASDAGYGIALGSGGAVFITGQTGSTDFPLQGAAQSSDSGLAAFVAKLTFGALPGPVAVSVTPAAGSGSSQTFSFLYSQVQGYEGIERAMVNLGATQTAVNACYVEYIRSTNTILLATNDGSGWVGTAVLGTSSSLQNSQCTVNAEASSAFGSDDTFTLNLNITFLAVFNGVKNIYMGVLNSSGVFSGWQQRGAWNVAANPAPTTVSVTPNSGSGASATFTFVYSDANGFADIVRANANFNSTLTSIAACYIEYTRTTNSIVLANDNGTGWVGSATLGAAGTLQNSQCVVNAQASSSSAVSNDLTLNLAVTFLSGLTGSQNVYMAALDAAGSFSGWQARGTWTVNSVPVQVSVTPASGTSIAGSAQNFSFLYSDLNGFADITRLNVSIGATLTSVGACYIEYTRATNTIVLANNDGSAWVGSAVLGSATTLTNSQCVVNAQTSSAPGTGNNLTLNLTITFSSNFGGIKNLFMAALDGGGSFSGWQIKGFWVVNAAPLTVSVTPSSGGSAAGAAQAFSFVYSDANSFTDFARLNVTIHSTLTSVNSCYIEYMRATNTVTLATNDGSGYVGSAVLGTASTLSNFQCSVHAQASSVLPSGDNLTLNLSITFDAAFGGARNIYMAALDAAGSFSGWQTRGTWTVNTPPTTISVSPASGSGTTQSFALTYRDLNGHADITRANLAVNTVLSSVNGCYVEYQRGSNLVSLASDDGSAWVGSLPLGGAGTLQNSRCRVNLSSSTSSGTSNDFILTLNLTFLGGFSSGTKNVYMAALDSVASFSGWQQRGTWTIP